MHFSFIDTVNELARGDWGCEFDNPQEAAKSLAANEQRLLAFGLVELLKRLNNIGASDDRAPKQSRKIFLSIMSPIVIHI